MVNFNKNYHFSRFQRGSNFFQGGGGGGGVQLVIPYRPMETNITCDFPGAGLDPLSPPLDPHLDVALHLGLHC